MKIQLIQDIIDIIRNKVGYITEYFYNLRIKDTYRIIPVGSFCLPRVITALCRLKRLKCFGEKTYPFDLAFYNDFDKIVELIDTEFKDFYVETEYKYHLYLSEKFSTLFNHDGTLSEQEFKEKYDKRIKNFYTDIQDMTKTVYFIYAGSKPLNNGQVENFINTIRKYRKDNFKFIIIGCNCTNEIDNNEIVYTIDNIDMKTLNKKQNWAKRLKTRNRKNDREAKKIFKSMADPLKKIIK